MKFTGNNLERLTKKIAQEILDQEERVHPYVGNNFYVFDEEELKKVIQEALEGA
jgi:thiamine pyrophosphate-dependent acetolactate synthase large subunit-like protein